jgi:hypothetical protein
MRRYVGARTVLCRETWGWSWCMGPGSVALRPIDISTCRPYYWKYKQNPVACSWTYFFFSLSFWYWFILQRLYSLGHVFCVILPSPFFFNKNTCHSLRYSPFLSLLYVLTCYVGQTKRNWTMTLDVRVSFVRLFMPCCGICHKILLISFWRCFLFNVSRTRLKKAVDIWTWLPWTVCGFQQIQLLLTHVSCLSVHAFNITDWLIQGY